MTKAELRKQQRAKRIAHVTGRGDNKITLNVKLNYAFKYLNKIDCFIASYWATKTECDVMTSLSEHSEFANLLCLPCATTKDEPLIFRRWQKGDEITHSPLGFNEPVRTAAHVNPDIILTPLLAFDRLGNRLGQGAGHYDRAFAELPQALRIGVAWACQEVEHVPTDRWDIPLDAVMTEQDWISMPNNRLSL